MSYERRYKITGGIPDAFKLYKREKIMSGEKFVDKSKYTEVCHLFNKMLSNKLITESFEFKIPYKLGYLRIKSIKMKYHFKDGKLISHKCPNWKETLTLWKRLYPDLTKEEIKQIPNKKLVLHTNEHTDGKIMRWYWDKRLSHFTNQTAYTFKPVKGPQENEYYENEDIYYYGRLGLTRWINNINRNNEYYL